MRFKKLIAIASASLVGMTMQAAPALADIALPNSGNGELVLFVKNEVTGEVYARGLGIFIDDVAPVAELQGTPNGGSLSYILPTIAPDSALTAFLQEAGTFVWTIMAGDNQGLNVVGDKRYLTTTPNANPPSITVAQINSNWNNLQAMLQTVNGAMIDAGGVKSIPTNGQWFQDGASPGQFAFNWFGTGVNNVNALGDSANFYALTTNGGFTGTARTYTLANVTMALNGTLSAVPLPGAVWLFGSALLGLVGVARRRSAGGDNDGALVAA